MGSNTVAGSLELRSASGNNCDHSYISERGNFPLSVGDNRPEEENPSFPDPRAILYERLPFLS